MSEEHGSKDWGNWDEPRREPEGRKYRRQPVIGEVFDLHGGHADGE